MEWDGLVLGRLDIIKHLHPLIGKYKKGVIDKMPFNPPKCLKPKVIGKAKVDNVTKKVQQVFVKRK
jgi:hypothetical protein